MVRVLITGGSSLLGRALTNTRPESVDLHSTWFTNYAGASYHLDIGNKSQVAYIFERVKPEIVVHCAAVGSVDYTEEHFTETRQVNVLGTENVLRCAQDFKALFVYISTNAVFDGSAPPYEETRYRQPVNRYGSIKREAENLVMATRNWLIIRPFMLYGWPYHGGRSNWFVTILAKLEKGETVKLVDDTYWQPSLAEDVAAAIWQLAVPPEPVEGQSATYGVTEVHPEPSRRVYHVASDERVSLYEFGLKIAEVWGYDKELVQPIKSSSLKGIAPRPQDTTFRLDKIHELGIRLRGIEEGLRALK